MNNEVIITETLESRSSVFLNYDAFDFLFMVLWMGAAFVLMKNVHESLSVIYMIFSFLTGLFLCTKSTMNSKRKNYESLYFILTKDLRVFRPFLDMGEDDEEAKR